MNKEIIQKIRFLQKLEGHQPCFRSGRIICDYESVGNRTQVANILTSFTIVCACDSNQVVEYRASNTTFTTINMTITGWFL